jgi:hypothetical protein
MVTRDRDRVKVAYILLDEIFLHVTHESERKFGREDTGILRLVFQNIGLYRTAHL